MSWLDFLWITIGLIIIGLLCADIDTPWLKQGKNMHGDITNYEGDV